MVSSDWYEAVIEKFGTVENFIDQLCEMQGLTKEDSVSMTSNIDTARDKRLMVFTSLLRTLNFVGHARVDQCYGLFVEFEDHLLQPQGSSEEKLKAQIEALDYKVLPFQEGIPYQSHSGKCLDYVCIPTEKYNEFTHIIP